MWESRLTSSRLNRRGGWRVLLESLSGRFGITRSPRCSRGNVSFLLAVIAEEALVATRRREDLCSCARLAPERREVRRRVARDELHVRVDADKGRLAVNHELDRLYAAGDP